MSAEASDWPWFDRSLPAAERAQLALREMTETEKLTLVNGHCGQNWPTRAVPPEGSVGPAGFVPGIERLGIPAQQQTDASLGVANLHDGIGATALPSGLALASSWDERVLEDGGRMIGSEARAKGFNVMLAGGCNLTREPRCGRNFEYLGEDPLLAGVLVGANIRGIQSNHIISTIKHFALNAQETGRSQVSVQMDEAAMRESDLLAFEIGIERGRPGAVMTAYNRVNQTYCGEHTFLLTDVLKRDWGFSGFTMSDWGGCHSTVAAAAGGLDQESGQELDLEPFFRAIPDAIADGRLSPDRLDDMAGRVLTSLFACGVIDHPNAPGGAIDAEANLGVAQRCAERGIVLLKNNGILPLQRPARVAVIGANADAGVLSGGGSTSVVPWGGFARDLSVLPPENPWSPWVRRRYHPSVPVEALSKASPGSTIVFADGSDVGHAADLAGSCDVAIVFVEQWTAEGLDQPDLALQDGQDALVSAVAAANANTLVVLQTGGAVKMPWLDDVAAVVAAWYPGGRGAEAIAAVLFGEVAPAGRLPITFPVDEASLPNHEIPGATVPKNDMGAAKELFDAVYPEGADVGYRWFARTRARTLFPFGHGLTYTTFDYENLTYETGPSPLLAFDVVNVGRRRGVDVAQVYLVSMCGEPALRLAGWATTEVEAGARARVKVGVDARLLARYDIEAARWHVAGGTYVLAVGRSSSDLLLHCEVELDTQWISGAETR